MRVCVGFAALVCVCEGVGVGFTRDIKLMTDCEINLVAVEG